MSLDALIPPTHTSNILDSGAGRAISGDYGGVLGTKDLSTRWGWGEGLLEPGVGDDMGVGHKHALAFGAVKQRPVLKI